MDVGLTNTDVNQGVFNTPRGSEGGEDCVFL